MNISTDPWIPIAWPDGSPGKVSLTDAFRRGHEIRDLALRPHERIAVMRLLICVAQTSLDGPKDLGEWRICKPRLPTAAEAYLMRWHDAFELLGDGQRFLQITDLEASKAKNGETGTYNDVGKLDLVLASGNNSTLFDNSGGSDRAFSSDALVRMLLAYQNFSPGGLTSDVAWAGKSMGRSSVSAPCSVRSMLHSYLKRQSLLETIHANLITREQAKACGIVWGVPVWENVPSDSDATVDTYLGRLTPLSRCLKLAPEGKAALIGAGIAYSPEFREPAATIVIRERNDKDVRVLLSASAEKAIWRELHAIAVVRRQVGGPLCLANIDLEEACDMWVGALISNKAKLVDVVESTFHIPAYMFQAQGQELYSQGVAHSETWNRRLGAAVTTFRKNMKDKVDGEGWKRGMALKNRAAVHYWTSVERNVPDLLSVVEDPEPLGNEWRWHATKWGRSCMTAARLAYDLACPHETPRQMQAYAAGLRVLFKAKGEDAATSKETE